MKGSNPKDLICLHTGGKGDYWHVDSSGSFAPFDKLYTEASLEPGDYRVIGCPSNYRLITELYSRLSQQEVKAWVRVGSDRVGTNHKATLEEALNCLTVLRVHDALPNRWHTVTSQSFNNYLLLRANNEEGFSDLVETVFKHHCMAKHFEFAGIPKSYAIRLVSLIVDPRWFLSVSRPLRMQPFEAYFGLTPAYFEKAWEAGFHKVPTAKSVRTSFLINTVSVLDEESFIRESGAPAESDKYPRNMQGMRYACKRLLGYLVRNWLKELGLEGYFDPDVFFVHGSFGREYQHRFGNKR